MKCLALIDNINWTGMSGTTEKWLPGDLWTWEQLILKRTARRACEELLMNAQENLETNKVNWMNMHDRISTGWKLLAKKEAFRLGI